MKLNADLGESYGNWQHNSDADIMPFIDQANIACGFHAGDPKTMQDTILSAKRYHISIGAHPAYPDLQGFGRRSMRIPKEELIPILHAQIATLEGMAKCQNMQLSYVKPHGALYNDMMKNTAIFADVIDAISSYHTLYPLMVQSLAKFEFHQELAGAKGIQLIREVFADRRYTDEGFLQSRQASGAVLSSDEALQQASLLIKEGIVISSSGNEIELVADTMCVHGDTPQALDLVSKIRTLLHA